MKTLKLSHIKTLVLSSMLEPNAHNEVMSSLNADPSMIPDTVIHIVKNKESSLNSISPEADLILDILKLPAMQSHEKQLCALLTIFKAFNPFPYCRRTIYWLLFNLFEHYNSTSINPLLKKHFDDALKVTLQNEQSLFSILSPQDQINMISAIKNNSLYNRDVLTCFKDKNELSVIYFLLAEQSDNLVLPHVFETLIKLINSEDKQYQHAISRGFLFLIDNNYFINDPKNFTSFISKLSFNGLSTALSSYHFHDEISKLTHSIPLTSEFLKEFFLFSLNSDVDQSANPYSLGFYDAIRIIYPTADLFIPFFKKEKSKLSKRTFKLPLYTPKNKSEEIELVNFYLSEDAINEVYTLIKHTELSIESIETIVEYDNNQLTLCLSDEYNSLPHHVIDELANHCNNRIRRSIAFRKDTPESVEKRLKSIIKESNKKEHNAIYSQSSFNKTLSGLKGSHSVFCNEYGYDLFQLKRVESPKKITHFLLNSKHSEEVRFLFESEQAISLSGISALQGVFTNRKGKLDRDSYLKTLKMINDAVIKKSYLTARQALFAVDIETLKTAFDFFSFEELALIMNNNPSDEARDILRMTHSLISSDDPDEKLKQTKLIRRWLDKEGLFGYALHAYLTNKATRDLSSSGEQTPFYQECDGLSSINQLAGLPKGVNTVIPQCAKELRSLGQNQSHCVGTKYYADACRQGSSIIFALVRNNKKTSTYTFQVNRDGTIMQSKGFANTPVPSVFSSLAQKVGAHILNVLKERDDRRISVE